MKRLSMAMTALAVLGLMTMVSCRKPNIGNVPGESRTITFNATTESNGGSKTYLDGLDVKWSENDKINVNGTEFNLVKGENTTFGSFTGTVGTVSGGYLAGYPADAENDGTNITFTISDNQNGNADFDYKFPLAAYTTNETADLSFKNMVNVLKLDLTGEQTITTIEVESAAENLSGDFTVGTGLTPNYITSGTKKITIDYTGDPLDLTTGPTVYVVLPVFGSAESTVTVKFTGAEGEMTVGPKALTGSTTPNHKYSAGVSVLLETSWDAYVVTIPVCAVHSTCASSGGVVTGKGVDEQGVCWGTSANPTVDGRHYVHQYEYATGSLTPKNTTSNNTFTGFIGGSPDSENRLKPGTTYHVRAYIRNGSQVKYGDDVEFKTLTDAEEPAVTGVDLGLPSGRIWATCNLGAANEYDYGDYYQWGDNAACTGTTSDKTVNCVWQSYRFSARSTPKFTKYGTLDYTGYWYNYSASTNEPDNKLQLELTDDCVRQTLGDDWRMPTIDEWKELYENTTNTWTTSGGVYGRRFTGKGDYIGNSIFLPAAGLRNGKIFNNVGTFGHYWSSSLGSGNPQNAFAREFQVQNINSPSSCIRYRGFTVRPVR